MLSLVALIVVTVLLFGGIFFWALVIQPRAEQRAGELSTGDAWNASGLEQFAAGQFSLYQIVPPPDLTRAEFHFKNEAGGELGRYTTSGPKSGELEYGGRKANLYIQAAPFWGSVYAGKVGGSSNRSTVIRDESHVIAEAWREKVLPAPRYRLVYQGKTLVVAAGGLSVTLPGSITRNGEQIGAFRRPSGSSRNLFVALRTDLEDELKVCLCAILLLR